MRVPNVRLSTREKGPTMIFSTMGSGKHTNCTICVPARLGFPQLEPARSSFLGNTPRSDDTKRRTCLRVAHAPHEAADGPKAAAPAVSIAGWGAGGERGSDDNTGNGTLDWVAAMRAREGLIDGDNDQLRKCWRGQINRRNVIGNVDRTRKLSTTDAGLASMTVVARKMEELERRVIGIATTPNPQNKENCDGNRLCRALDLARKSGATQAQRRCRKPHSQTVRSAYSSKLAPKPLVKDAAARTLKRANDTDSVLLPRLALREQTLQSAKPRVAHSSVRFVATSGKLDLRK